MGMEGLPHYVAFKGDNGKYLGFYLDNKYRGVLKFGYDELSSPYVKHELVTDPTDNSYVHIKCCYNNKFWRIRAPKQWWIFAGADSVNRDQSIWSCTRFDPKFDVGSKKVTLRHLQLNKLSVRWRLGAREKLDSCLFAGEDGKTNKCGVMTYYDLDFFVTLPKYVSFKGDNGMYLAVSWIEGHEYLQFNTTDIGEERVRHEVVPLGDGTVRLKCLHSNKFWRRSPNWIWADTATCNSSNKDLLFEPIKVDDQRVRLRCLGNNLFCKRLTTEGKTNCLNAGTGSLDQYAILRVEEPIMRRRVHSINYDMDTAHIYDIQPLVLCKVSATNNSDQPTTLQVGYAYTDIRSTTWKWAFSLATGIQTTIETGIPLVVDGKVEISSEGSVTHEWGVTEETHTTISRNYPAPVEAGQMVEVSVKATRAKCDVKFSYIQEDLDTTGHEVQFRRDDGVFNGVNYTDIQFETRYC